MKKTFRYSKLHFSMNLFTISSSYLFHFISPSVYPFLSVIFLFVVFFIFSIHLSSILLLPFFFFHSSSSILSSPFILLHSSSLIHRQVNWCRVECATLLQPVHSIGSDGTAHPQIHHLPPIHPSPSSWSVCNKLVRLDGWKNECWMNGGWMNSGLMD